MKKIYLNLPISNKAKKSINALMLSQRIRMKCLLFAGILGRSHARRGKRDKCRLHTRNFLFPLLGDRDYKEVLGALEELGIIEIDTKYVVGSKSRSYRLKREFLDDLEIETVIGPPIAEPSPDFIKQPFLRETSISEEGQREVINQLLKMRSRAKKTFLRLAVEQILKRNWWISQQAVTGRVCTNVSNVNSFVRPYLLLRGEKVAEIDISNSQPYFMASLYPRDSDESRRYRSMVCSGQFYEEINRRLTEPLGDLTNKKLRTKLKRRLFTEIFFGRLESRREVWGIFSEMFPELAGEIVALKERESYKALALELQSKEALAIVFGVMAECVVLDIPVLTVHDSVLCREKDWEKVWSLIEHHCFSVVGAFPNLKRAA